MSTPTHRSRTRQDVRNAGLPTWSGVAIVIAALITGLLLSVNAQTIGTPYLVCFGVAAIVVALFTEARGLFIVVASLPLLFGIMTVVSSWTVTRSLAAEGSAAFSTTTILTALFPLAQFFPVMFGVSAAAAIIAVLRIWLLRRSGRARDAAAIEHRRRASEADRVNRDTASRARRRTNQVTVEELLARNRSRSGNRGGDAPPGGPAPLRTPPRPEPPHEPPRQQRDPREPLPREPKPPRRRRLDDDLYS
ncbi:DUF6542 domain-containing protein [Corynebacterium comes]|uniref:DUF6542 domain-containing protein n=1 Tax=Corynebacterium comes TaxID=2675218 RepID=A0A6B8VS33_9CORY|nr:DUF6542 domain-containing protein [Corynebacterium comes]QGU04164.1 hypothetical protein CETAM_04465 [Corynebacterium comes]